MINKMTSHKTLMILVIVLALVHMILSGVVGVLLFNNNLSKELTLGFCIVSVVVNAIIMSLAISCKEKSSDD